MPLTYFEVHVPMCSSVQTSVRGLHVFSGRADSCSSALRIAREVYAAAHAAAEAGLEIPHGHMDGWGACGYRPGWELDWSAATAGRWANVRRSAEPRAFEL
ncbi:hypothetical protein ACIA78_21775 [Streptomyces xanthochromogenes]|uniref:hypothetical protein n=1 Tax=Streptomyces xanthochromogenes TaxID=67384 RepID=UPI0037B3ABC1